MSQEDLIVWPDGTWCFVSDLPSMSWKSDDYEHIPCGSDRWRRILEEAE